MAISSKAARLTAARKPFFKCPNCEALYHIVKVEAGPQSADNVPRLRRTTPRPRSKIRYEVFPVAESQPQPKMEEDIATRAPARFP